MAKAFLNGSVGLALCVLFYPLTMGTNDMYVVPSVNFRLSAGVGGFQVLQAARTPTLPSTQSEIAICKGCRMRLCSI